MGVAVAIDRDVERQDTRPHGHAREGTGAIRPTAYGAAMERLRSLSEDECYLRCYGWRGSDDSVRLVPSKTPKHDLRFEQPQAGERLRRLLEVRIDARESFEVA
jgi:hypothetical protein